jgi:glycosyltransferase involved in cell wall biosynthesis
MSAKHVLIDGYFLGKPYGFGRFIFELCRALGQSASDLQITVAVPTRAETNPLPRYSGLSWHFMPDANFAVWEQIHIPGLARKLGCGVIHFPYNTRALFVRGACSVTTVHDLLFLSNPRPFGDLKSYLAQQYARFVFWTATAKSSALISVSNTTCAALTTLGYEATVVYNTVDGFLENARVAPSSKARQFFLHRGGYAPHRNTARVIEAFRLAQHQFPEIELKIVGAPDGAAFWNISRDPKIDFLPRLSDAELGKLYSDAIAVVATSLQEGFGLPIIEAFGFNTPVITSNVDPMREIAADAAILVNPFSSTEIASAMTTIANDPVRAETLVREGRIRLKDFSSARVGEQILSVYAALLGTTIHRER